jgi:hypothetical protein
MTAGRMISLAETKQVRQYERVITHFEGVFSEATRAYIASYTENLATKAGKGVRITLDTRVFKDAMNDGKLSVVIADSSPIHAGREVLVTRAGFTEVNGSELDFDVFQVTIPLGNTGFGHNFKFIRDGANGPRLYIN